MSLKANPVQLTAAGKMTGHQPRWHYLVIIACAFLVCLPLFLQGPSCGHDFDFHLQSWFAASGAWHSHLLSPHWVPAANYGAGEPRFVFYPPLSWALGALLGALISWTVVPQAFTLLALVACGTAFYTLARRWVRAPTAAAAACVYLANPYLLFVAYERTAYGELLGAITMPFIVLYSLQTRPPVVKLALAVAVLWFTNAPAAVMGCYLLALCSGAAALAARSLLPAARAGAALTLGTGLASVYVLPAWYQQRWVEIARVVGPGMRVEDSFLFGHTGEPFHDQVLHTASSISVVVLGAGLLCMAVTWRMWHTARRTAPGGPGQALPAPNLLYAVLTTALFAILLLLLPLSDPVWRFAPQLHFLQFPWRWLLVGSLMATLAGALAADSPARKRPGSSPRRLYAAALAVTLCAASWAAGHYAQNHFAQTCDEEDNVRAQQTLLAADDAGLAASTTQPAGARPMPGFEGTDEYTPTGADNGELQRGLPAVRLLHAPGDDEGDDSTTPNPPWQPSKPREGSIRISLWSPEHKHLTLTTPTPRFAVLRLLDYPAWRVQLNGQTVSARPHREDGLLTIPIPAGTSIIDVTYQATHDVYAGRVISLLSLAALAGTAAWSRRSRPVA